MTQLHSLQLEDMQSEVSLTNANTRESENDSLRCREVSCTIRPILRLMRLTHGDIAMDGVLEEGCSVFSRLYCWLVLLGQWFIVVQAVTSLFFEGVAQMNTFFFLLIFSIWYLQSAVVNTICLFILPKGQKKPSRLGQFLGNLLATTSNGGINACNLYKVYSLLVMVSLCSLQHCLPYTTRSLPK